MRTITLPSTLPSTSTTPALTVSFHYAFGSIYYNLGRLYNRINSASVDRFIYTSMDYNPTRLRDNVNHYCAPGRDIKAMVYCSITTGAYTFGGMSFCFIEDIFSRQTGERLALRRALEMVDKKAAYTGLQFNTPLRTRIWQAWLASYNAAAAEWVDGVDGVAVKREEISINKPEPSATPRASQPPTDALLRLLALIAAIAPPPVPGLRSPFSFR